MDLGTQIIYQTIGIIALILCALSFQFKSNKTFLIIQCISSTLFAIQFVIGGAWAGFMMNCISIVRSLSFAFTKNKKIRLTSTIILALAYLTSMLISIFLFKEQIYIAILIGIASIGGTISIFFDNEKVIRYVQMLFVSPCWLVNNIVYMTIGGIIAECLNIVSSLIALIRWKLKENKHNNTWIN